MVKEDFTYRQVAEEASDTEDSAFKQSLCRVVSRASRHQLRKQ